MAADEKPKEQVPPGRGSSDTQSHSCETQNHDGRIRELRVPTAGQGWALKNKKNTLFLRDEMDEEQLLRGPASVLLVQAPFGGSEGA